MSIRPPIDAIVAVTHRCNAQCVMCNIWKSTAADTLQPEHMRNLPAGLRTVNLTGGEPFLRDDLPQFVQVIRKRCPAAQITISSNAYLPERIEATMREIRRIDPAIRLAVSLDGVGDAHNTVRARPDAFDRAMTLIRSLQADGFGGLRLSMTISRGNVDQILAVAELAESRQLEMGIVAAHGASTHLGVDSTVHDAMPGWLREPFETITRNWLRSWRPKLWLRAHFAAGTYAYLRGRKWTHRCRAGEAFFFVQADGTVYHCSVHGRLLGNLAIDAWEDLWNSTAARDARHFAKECPERCWMICTARSAYRQQAARYAAWILWNKLRTHLRCFHLPPMPSEPNEVGHANPAR